MPLNLIKNHEHAPTQIASNTIRNTAPRSAATQAKLAGPADGTISLELRPNRVSEIATRPVSRHSVHVAKPLSVYKN